MHSASRRAALDLTSKATNGGAAPYMTAAVLAVIALRAKMIGLSDHVQPRASWEMIFKMENYSNPLL